MFERIFDSIRPAVGAEVMETGSVSIAVSAAGFETLSRILLVIAVLLWAWLAALLPVRASRDHARFLADVRTPASLTCAASNAVTVLTNWTTPTAGGALVLTVATESLAVLAASLAVAGDVGWLLAAALLPFALGLCFYMFVIVRLDVRQLAAAHSRPSRSLCGC